MENGFGRVLVTGAAGFIGFHLCRRLLDEGARVTGLDNLNDYYDVQLKRDRLSLLTPYASFTFLQQDLADRQAMTRLVEGAPLDIVVNLGAVKSHDYSAVQRELEEVVTVSNLAGLTEDGDDILTKVIIEVGLTTREEQTRVCRIAKAVLRTISWTRTRRSVGIWTTPPRRTCGVLSSRPVAINIKSG